LWTADGSLYKGKERPRLDDVAKFLIPKIMQAKSLLAKKTKKKGNLHDIKNAKILTAMLCDNTDSSTRSLEEFAKTNNIDDTRQPNSAKNILIRAKLVELCLVILQAKPFQVRMNEIFDCFHVESTGKDDSSSEQIENVLDSSNVVGDISNVEGGVTNPVGNPTNLQGIVIDVNGPLQLTNSNLEGDATIPEDNATNLEDSSCRTQSDC